MINFTAIDFETATEEQTSACSIGIAVVEHGELIFTEHYYIKPPNERFSAGNIAIHGITWQDVEHAPTFDALWPSLEPHLAGKTVAAHFAPFDMGVLLATLDHYGIARPDMDIVCSCQLSRIAYPTLPNHKLSTLCDHLGIPLKHHTADSDAQGSAEIILKIAARYGIASLDDLRHYLHVTPGSVRGGIYTPTGPR